MAARRGDSRTARRRRVGIRSVPVTRRPDAHAQRADVVVDALVHARLFRRFELLTLDAQVLVGSPGDPDVWESADRSAVPPRAAIATPTRDGGLAYARELLDEGAQVLEQAREMTIQAERRG